MSALPIYNQPISRIRYKLADYLAMEQENAETLYEFNDGEIYSRVGRTDTHNEIALNLAFFFRQIAKEQGKPCRTYVSDVKLEVAKDRKYYYPDVFVTCSEADKDSALIKKEPTIIVEVLSNRTSYVDNHVKKIDYLALKSLQYYIQVHQDRAVVEVYERNNDFFMLKIIQGIDNTLTLKD